MVELDFGSHLLLTCLLSVRPRIPAVFIFLALAAQSSQLILVNLQIDFATTRLIKLYLSILVEILPVAVCLKARYIAAVLPGSSKYQCEF